jgi:hypothetical protein
MSVKRYRLLDQAEDVAKEAAYINPPEIVVLASDYDALFALAKERAEFINRGRMLNPANPCDFERICNGETYDLVSNRGAKP